MFASEAFSVCAEVAIDKEESLTEMGSEVAHIRDQMIQEKYCLVSTQG